VVPERGSVAADQPIKTDVIFLCEAKEISPSLWSAGLPFAAVKQGRGRLGQRQMAVKKAEKTRTHFTFRIDTWSANGESIIEHVFARSNST
jgi:hypothetical protein